MYQEEIGYKNFGSSALILVFYLTMAIQIYFWDSFHIWPQFCIEHIGSYCMMNIKILLSRSEMYQEEIGFNMVKETIWPGILDWELQVNNSF
jgi:hypothetical protein